MRPATPCSCLGESAMHPEPCLRAVMTLMAMALWVVPTLALASLTPGFIENLGQLEGPASFYAPLAGGTHVYLTPDAIVVDVRELARGSDGTAASANPALLTPEDRLSASGRGCAVWIRFEDANPDPVIEGREQLPGSLNYLIGADGSRWRTDVAAYAEVVYHDLWPGIDLVLRRQDGALSYRLDMDPQADSRQVRFAYEGAERVLTSFDDAAVVETPYGSFMHTRPTSDGWLDAVATTPSQADRGGPDGRDDPSALLLSTYLGGSGDDDWIDDMVVDASGYVYVVGSTDGGTFPVTSGAYDQSFNGADDVFVAKIDPTFSSLVYATFIGGTGEEHGRGIAVQSGLAYVTACAHAADFPTTTGAYDTTHNGGIDVAVFKLNAAGSALAFSTFVGGSADDNPGGIAVDSSGYAYVAGDSRSGNFPTTTGAYDRTHGGTSYTDGFLFKLQTSGGGLSYSTFVGGTDADAFTDIYTSGGPTYVVGYSSSSNYPTTTIAYDRTWNGGSDCVATRISSTGSSLEWSSYLGGSQNDYGEGVWPVSNVVVVAGSTESADFPTTAGSFDTSLGGASDAFVAEMYTGSANLKLSTLLGGSGDDYARALAVDAAGCPVVIGSTYSADFPVTHFTYDSSQNGDRDAFVTRLSSTCQFPYFSTLLGGSGRDAGDALALGQGGSLYVAGVTGSTDFPTTSGVLGSALAGATDGFLSVLAAPPAAVIGVPSDAVSIAEALSWSRPGDEIVIGCGTYHEHGLVMRTGVTLRSETGLPDCVTIDGDNVESVLNCTYADTATSIRGVTIRRGKAGSSYSGGGIYCYSSSLRLRDVVLTGNTAASSSYVGSAMYCEGGYPVFRNLTVSANTNPVTGACAAVYLRNSSAVLVGGMFSGNSYYGLGGSSVEVRNSLFTGNGIGAGVSGQSIVADCEFRQNTSYGLVVSGTTVEVDRCTVVDNSGTGLTAGGGVLIRDCALLDNSGNGAYSTGATFVDCEFTGNVTGLRCSKGSTTSVTGGTFSDNSGWAAVYCDSDYEIHSSLSLTGVEITGNRTRGLSCSDGSTCTLNGCVISGNVASDGGAGISSYGDLALTYLSLTNCTISDNTTAGGGLYSNGGGIHVYGTCLTLDDVLVSGNSAEDHGGGLCIEECTSEWNAPSLSNVVFSGNSAASGGGVYMAGGSGSFSRCTLSGNVAGSSGGGIYLYYARPSISQCTLSGNSSPLGGGIRYENEGMFPFPTLDNTIIANCPSGEGLRLTYNSPLTLSCCDIHGNAGGDWVGAIASQYGLRGNISEDPLFCGSANPLEPLTLASNSPCAPENSGTCGLIGAWPVGCPPPENVVCDPIPRNLTASAPVGTVDVKYLGGGSGPVYGYSLKLTWDGAIAHTSADSVAEGTLLSGMGTTFFDARRTGDHEIIVDCALLGDYPGVSDPGTLFTVTFTGLAAGTSPVDITVLEVRDRDNVPLSGFQDEDGELIVDVQNPLVTNVLIENLTLTHTDDFIKNHDAARVTAAVTDDNGGFGIGSIKADLTGLGGGASVAPQSYDGGVATWQVMLTDVACTPADGTVTVTVTATDPLGNVGSGSDDIIADNTKPTAVTDFDAVPGHEECGLSWANGTDTYLAGVTVRRLGNSEYPLYTLFRSAWPLVDAYYPATPLSGAEAYNGTGTSAADAVIPRDIYYYQTFCYDEARNYSDASSSARDLATNYWLGDVAAGLGAWGYNGLVNDADIDKLGYSYTTVNPSGNIAECDVGPTVHPDHSRFGLPLPDLQVQFEDLMIFSMNYGVVAPRIVPFLSEPADEALALALEEISTSPEGEVQVALRLEGNAGETKGVSAVITFDPTQLEYVSARLSGAMASPIAETFFWSGTEEGKVLVDLAVLGTGVTIGGSGEVAVLTFRALTSEYALGFEDALLRGVENEQLDAELEGLESRPEMPTAFRLAQNVPNPFNPKTTVAYEVPQASAVAIRVYDVAGRLVTTLVDGTVEPGRYSVTWNGTASGGESVGSGVYFCVMETPEYHATHKMMLLK